jgi:hypothetical protein
MHVSARAGRSLIVAKRLARVAERLAIATLHAARAGAPVVGIAMPLATIAGRAVSVAVHLSGTHPSARREFVPH